MRNESTLALRGRLIRFAGSGTIATLMLLLVALWLVFAITIGDRFFSVNTLQSMAFQMPELGILSLAMMLALLSGGLNLSIIATANLSGLTIAFLLTHYIPGTQGIAWVGVQVLAIAAGFAVAALVGLVNGFVIAYLGVSPILATLGTMTLCKGLAIGLTRGNVISGFPEPIVFIGNGTVLGVPFALIVLALCALPVALMLNATPLRGKGLHDRLEREGNPLLRRRYPRRPAQAICPLEPARRCRSGRHAGTFQFSQRGIWRELSARHHSCSSARWRRSIWRLWQGRRIAACADNPSGDLLGVQPSQSQPVPHSGDLGGHPDCRCCGSPSGRQSAPVDNDDKIGSLSPDRGSRHWQDESETAGRE
ncbi:hypothetical protein ACVWZ3_006813 [Bradyrhizobium sp. i1.3.6]